MEFAEAQAKMTEAGADHGRAAASWYFDGNTQPDEYRVVIEGIEIGDPRVLDTFPSSPLSGEWADAPTPTSVLSDVLGTGYDDEAGDFNEHALDEFLNAYEDAFHSAAHDEIERVARLQVEPEPVPCQYFARCENVAVGTVPNVVLGPVPCCDRCAAVVGVEDDLTRY